MKNETMYDKLNEHDLRKLLDVRDPIDRLVLELVEDGELKIGVVDVKGERFHFFKKHLNHFLFNIGWHSN